MYDYDLIVIGGGAAGYFGAIAFAEARPQAKVLILEATPRTLTKVKVSGGGRCNVTHHQFDPKQLISNYPRGQRELLGPFHHFGPRDTVAWFAQHGVELKVEADGRMFPVSNSSQTIIDCLEGAARNSHVSVMTKTLVTKVKHDEQGFEVQSKTGQTWRSLFLLMASGSMPFGYALLQDLGHKLVDPVPSLFTFEIDDPLLKELPGTSFPKLSLQLKCSDDAKVFSAEGPGLITHWGLSGPAVLRLSAFAARDLHQSSYSADLLVNWQPPLRESSALEILEEFRKQNAKKKVSNDHPFAFTRRFWESLLRETGIQQQTYADLSRKLLQDLAKRITGSVFKVKGKGVFKEEFVTAGGVALSEIDFRSMQSKLISGLYFAGEVLDVDGVTGGFNFQNAWTSSWLAARSMAQSAETQS